MAKESKWAWNVFAGCAERASDKTQKKFMTPHSRQAMPNWRSWPTDSRVKISPRE
jgi:hypothetical protein